jgi:transcriptional regulator with XRE-family HTH domain
MITDGMELLAKMTRLRRERIGLGQDELADYGGPAVTTVGKIERGVQSRYAPRTLQQMDKALGWPRGTCAEIISAPLEGWWESQGDDYEHQWVEWDLPDLTEPSRPHADMGLGDLLAELTYRVKAMDAELAQLRREGSNDVRTTEAEKTPLLMEVTGEVLDLDDGRQQPAPGQRPGAAAPQAGPRE